MPSIKQNINIEDLEDNSNGDKDFEKNNLKVIQFLSKHPLLEIILVLLENARSQREMMKSCY